ncbi:MAG TPA: acetate uptake transporter [Nocardioidaceae bacterium]|nr:acetate uptake transporter [Nocardioidaceae bacterium]
MTAIKEPEPIQQTAFAPGSHIADPAALGLGGFALTTFVLSVANANIVPIAVTPVVFGLALAYGGIAQFAAGIWEFAKGNTFGATAFCSYGGFWISYWYLTGHTDLSGAGSDVNQGVGLYLIAWAIFTGYMTVAATRTNTAVLAVFVLLTITYILLAIGEFATADGITHIGGYLGIATALAAWYASWATVTNFTFKRTVLPVGPRA